MKTRFGIIRRFHMKKMGIILVIVAISVCLLFMRSNDTNQQPKNSEIAPTKKEGEVDQTKEISTEESIVEDQLAEMSLDEKIGQLIIAGDRKSTRLNSSHVAISYAVFCLKKKKKNKNNKD